MGFALHPLHKLRARLRRHERRRRSRWGFRRSDRDRRLTTGAFELMSPVRDLSPLPLGLSPEHLDSLRVQLAARRLENFRGRLSVLKQKPDQYRRRLLGTKGLDHALRDAAELAVSVRNAVVGRKRRPEARDQLAQLGSVAARLLCKLGIGFDAIGKPLNGRRGIVFAGQCPFYDGAKLGEMRCARLASRFRKRGCARWGIAPLFGKTLLWRRTLSHDRTDHTMTGGSK